MKTDTPKPNPASTPWYSLVVDAVFSRLNTTDQGLSVEEITARQAQYGPNELVERSVKKPLDMLIDQFKETMVIVLIIAAVVSGLLSDWKDAIVIFIIVLMNAVLGFVQEYRAEQAMAALKRMSAPVVKVRRAGHLDKIPSRELVPGDIVLLEAGDSIPADCRLVESFNLRVQEASLTGESVPVEKHTPVIARAGVPLADRDNMVFMGTVATYGRGAAVVCETGMQTELGRIADLLQAVTSDQTPLQKRMAQLGKSLAWLALAIVAVVFLLGLLRGEEVVTLFLTAVAMAVAAVPEGLPAVVTISLALGAQRMLKRRALIRKLPAVEALGSVTTICSDKTGTLTENRMTVTILDVMGESQTLDTMLEKGIPITDPEPDQALTRPERTLALLVKASTLCNDAILELNESTPRQPGLPKYRLIGDPTEGALVAAAANLGLWKPDLDQRWPRVAEAPFSSERKRMTTVHQVNALSGEPAYTNWYTTPYIAFCKGAVDGMLDICSQVWSGDHAIPLTPELSARIQEANNDLAKDGQRVLGVAFRNLAELPDPVNEETLEQDMTFIGLVAMMDPPRPEVKEAVALCQTAGIRPVMITGDHPLTAQRIAYDLGITTNDKVLTGVELATMSQEELEKVVEEVSVYARVAPEHKLNIVQALQTRGHVVAMTGDGVNDAPALRRSDIGVAMGITGTDVSKEASDMVILDDNFATIVSAVSEGRTIYENVRKFIRYTMTSNAGEIYVMLLAPFLGMPLPLTAIQILWVNLVTDGLPGLALAVEPSEPNTMRRPPVSMNEGIFARGMGAYIFWIGLLMGLVSLFSGYFGWLEESATWTTMVFTTLTLVQMANALAVRSDQESILTLGLFTNKPLLGAILLTFVLQMLVTYWPPLQSVFGTQALSALELAASVGLSAFVFVLIEIYKAFLRRQNPDR